jgi:hypothetical protein
LWSTILSTIENKDPLAKYSVDPAGSCADVRCPTKLLLIMFRVVKASTGLVPLLAPVALLSK